jgi:hypothetical protein
MDHLWHDLLLFVLIGVLFIYWPMWEISRRPLKKRPPLGRVTVRANPNPSLD